MGGFQMEINEKFLKNLAEKYNFLQERYCTECIEKLNNIQRSDLNLFYSKHYHYSEIGDIFSNGLLRHIDAGKCLYKQPSTKIRKSADINDYYALYYNSNHQLLISEPVYSHYFKLVTIYFDENIQITYSVDDDGGDSSPQFRFMEYTEYSNGNVLSCEKFAKQYNPPYGVEINGEYYEYEGIKLISAIKIENYNTAYEPFQNPVLRFEFIPGRILNPDIFYYDFKYDNSEKLICKKTQRYTTECTKENTLTLVKSEIEKLKKFGVNCFELQ